jgi:hypothetical protein
MCKSQFILSVLLILVFTTVLSAIPGPVWWNRGDPGTTWQEWTFDDGESAGVVPETWFNIYGTPTADIEATGNTYGDAGWYAEWLGRQGVWHGDVTAMTLHIPDTPNPDMFKEIWVEVGFRGFLEVYQVLEPPVGATDLGYTIEDAGAGWKTLTFGFRIVPNPPYETIYFRMHNSGADVDYVTADTICVPEPATLALLGLGIPALLRKRR